MTADTFQAIVLRLANAHPTRYWLHWNSPNREPWVMALRVYPTNASPGVPESIVGEMAKAGLEWDECDRAFYAERTNPDGTPFR